MDLFCSNINSMKKALTPLSILILLLTWGGIGNFCKAQDSFLVDSLTELLKKANATSLELGTTASLAIDTTKSNIYYKLSCAYQDNNPDKAIEYAKQALSLAQSTQFTEGSANANSSLGKAEYNKGNFLSAIAYYKRAIQYYKSIGLKKEVVNSYKGIGQCYIELGNFPEAISSLIASLKSAEDIADKNGIAYAHLSLGICYFYSNKLDEALQSWNIALNIFKEINDKAGIAKSNANLGNYYCETGNFAKALPYYQNVITICKQTGNLVGLTMAYNNIAKIHFEQSNYLLALQTCLQALSIIEQTGDKNNASITYTALGEIYFKMKQFSKSHEYLNKALILTQETGNLDLKRYVYDAFVNLCSEQNNFKQALQYYKLSIAVHDTMFNEENNRKIAELQLQYDTEKKEKNIALLTKKSQLQQAEIQTQNTTRFVLFVAFVLIAFLVVLIFNRYSLKKKANIEIERTMNHLKTTQNQLVENEKLAALGKITADVAREIAVPVNQVNETNLKNNRLIDSIENNTLNSDIRENLQINFDRIYRFGKEADSMVKKILNETRKL